VIYPDAHVRAWQRRLQDDSDDDRVAQDGDGGKQVEDPTVNCAIWGCLAPQVTYTWAESAAYCQAKGAQMCDGENYNPNGRMMEACHDDSADLEYAFVVPTDGPTDELWPTCTTGERHALSTSVNTADSGNTPQPGVDAICLADTESVGATMCCTVLGNATDQSTRFSRDEWTCENDAATDAGLATAIFINAATTVVITALVAVISAYCRNKSQNKAPFNGQPVEAFAVTPKPAMVTPAQMQIVQMQCPVGYGPGSAVQVRPTLLTCCNSSGCTLVSARHRISKLLPCAQTEVNGQTMHVTIPEGVVSLTVACPCLGTLAWCFVLFDECLLSDCCAVVDDEGRRKARCSKSRCRLCRWLQWPHRS
jgi:hypothetical protein